MENEFDLQLTLERLAMVQIAAAIWRTPSVVQQVKGFFMTVHANEFKLPLVQYVTDRHQKDDWSAIITSIKALNFDMIPVSLRSPLMYLVEQMGMRIFEWLREMTAKLLKYSKYERYPQNIEYFIDNIQWTSIGTIDQTKIYKNRYADSEIGRDYFMWYEACNYCLEDCARELWSTMSEETKRKTKSKIDTRIDGDFCLVTYWQCKISEDSDLKQKLFSNNIGMVSRLCSSRDSIEVVMFKISVHQENEHAAKYFWERMNTEERKKQAISGCEIILERKCVYPYCFATYCKRCVDIFCFLLLRMTPKERNQLFANEFDKTYDPFNTWVLLLNWPWEDLFVLTLEQAWECFSIFDCKFFINKFETTVYTVDKNYALTETCTYHKGILYKVCMNSPRHLRPHFTSRYRQLTTPQQETQKRPRLDFGRRRWHKWIARSRH